MKRRFKVATEQRIRTQKKTHTHTQKESCGWPNLAGKDVVLPVAGELWCCRWGFKATSQW